MATTKNIQSISRALGILELYNHGKIEYSVKEISMEMDLSKSTAFGIINTLANKGYLQQNPENSKYFLGMKVLELSNAVQSNNIFIQITRPFLEELAEEFEETCHCAIEEGGSVIYIDKIESSKSFYIKSQVGTKNYIHCTGVGKCFLAYLPKNKVESILSTPLRAMTYNTLVTKEEIATEIEEIRNRGYAIDNEEIEIGLKCIAVPIFNANKEIIMSISVSGPTVRMNEENISKIALRLKEISHKISQKLLYV